MRLWYSQTSPYARKVRLVAIELGLQQQISLLPTNPLADPEDLLAVNPLAKIPALELADGDVLYDSPVICEYLDSLAAASMIPENGDERWHVLKIQALSDGVLDAAASRTQMLKRPASEHSDYWMQRWMLAIERSLMQMAKEVESLNHELKFAQICIACALGYLDFRVSELDWRKTHTNMAAWFVTVADHSSFKMTRPDL